MKNDKICKTSLPYPASTPSLEPRTAAATLPTLSALTALSALPAVTAAAAPAPAPALRATLGAPLCFAPGHKEGARISATVILGLFHPNSPKSDTSERSMQHELQICLCSQAVEVL